MDEEKSNVNLNNLIIEQKKQIEDLTSKLDVMKKVVDSLSYSISHDLKAPLRAIGGFSRLLYEDYESKLDIEGKHFLDSILRNVKYMAQQIDDLLKFSRVGSDPLYIENIDTMQLIKEIILELQSENTERIISFEIGDLPDIYGDKAMFSIVFNSLLSNAVKFTRNEEVAVIKIGCERKNSENTFFIQDNGVGFDMKYSGKLFGIFQRLHTEDEFEGLGAGLAIVQRIIHRHGGRNWIEAEKNIGATFKFSLPTNKAD